MESKIGLRAALSEMNKVDSVFSIEYRKLSGEYGSKNRCCQRPSSNRLNEVKRYNRSGLLKLRNLNEGGDFEVKIDFLLKFNGQGIDFLA